MAAQAPEAAGDLLDENAQVKHICQSEHPISGSDPGLSRFLLTVSSPPASKNFQLNFPLRDRPYLPICVV